MVNIGKYTIHSIHGCYGLGHTGHSGQWCLHHGQWPAFHLSTSGRILQLGGELPVQVELWVDADHGICTAERAEWQPEPMETMDAAADAGPILVHCNGGVHRSPALAAGGQMTVADAKVAFGTVNAFDAFLEQCLALCKQRWLGHSTSAIKLCDHDACFRFTKCKFEGVHTCWQMKHDICLHSGIANRRGIVDNWYCTARSSWLCFLRCAIGLMWDLTIDVRKRVLVPGFLGFNNWISLKHPPTFPGICPEFPRPVADWSPLNPMPQKDGSALGFPTGPREG